MGSSPETSPFAVLSGPTAMIKPDLFVSVIQGMCDKPRGREVAYRVAMRNGPFRQWYVDPLLLVLCELVNQGALPGDLTPDQDHLVWQTARQGYERFVAGSLTKTQMLQLMATWKGLTNFLGWGGVAASLDPQLRGPTAYILGHRYLRLSQPDQAQAFFRQALKDAPSDSPLKRLAKAELDRS
jgi:hypothetical protein